MKIIVLIEAEEEDVGDYVNDKNLVGLYASPTKFCNHLSPRDKTSFIKGLKYWWMICTECKKPVRTPFNTTIQYLYPYGKNLIDRYIVLE